MSTVDRDGLLTRKELWEGLIQEGYDKHNVEKRLPLLFGSLDKDGDGEITKQEFVNHLHMMNKIDTDALPPTPHADEVWGQGFAHSEVASEGWGSGDVSDSPGKYYQSHAVISLIACLHTKYARSVTLSFVPVRLLHTSIRVLLVGPVQYDRQLLATEREAARAEE